VQEEIGRRFERSYERIEKRVRIQIKARRSAPDDENEMKQRVADEVKSIRAALEAVTAHRVFRSIYRLGYDDFSKDDRECMADEINFDSEILEFHFHAAARYTGGDKHIREYPAALLVDGPLKKLMENELGIITIRKILSGLADIDLIDIVPCIKGGGTIAYRFDSRFKAFVENWYGVKDGSLEYNRKKGMLSPITATLRVVATSAIGIAALVLGSLLQPMEKAGAFEQLSFVPCLTSTEEDCSPFETDRPRTMAQRAHDGGLRLVDATSAQDYWDRLGKRTMSMQNGPHLPRITIVFDDRIVQLTR
jgi:hypothetical protein